MRDGKYFLETFGCQMNILDSQLIEGQLRARGMSPTSDHRDADVILFNTCSVRQHAEDKVLSRLGQIKNLKKARPETVIGVVGCMAERAKDDLFVVAPHVDLICGPGELNQLPALLDEVWERHEQVAALAGSQSRRTEALKRALEYDSLEALDLSRTPEIEGNVLQSYVRVQRGCDKFCTYCIVPFTRGPERSRPPEHVVDEARMLAEHGCREITLLGQTVNSYVHQDDGDPVTFAKLLERVHEIESVDRIRFVTSFPADWDEDIFRVMRDCPRIMPFLHIPAQSGSERVLKAMRRGYTVGDYLKLMETARKYVPDIALAGDFIVGFSGETEDDFRRTVDFVREIQYESLFVFKYSPRPGAKSERVMADDVPDEVKRARNNELLAVQNEISLKRKQALIGGEVEVLVEGLSKAARKAQGETAAQLRARGKGSPAMNVASGLRARRTDVDGPCDVAAGASPTDVASASPNAASASQNVAAGPRTGRVASAPRGRRPDSGGPTSGRSNLTQLVGRTPGDLTTIFDASTDIIGAIVKVRITDASAHTLFGEITETVSAV